MEHKNDVTILKDQTIKRKKQKAILEKSKESPTIIGDSGLYQFRLDDITSEFDPLLMGREGSKKFSEMSKSDGIIGGILSAYKNLILSCNWTFQEIEDITPEEQKVMDIMHEWLFTKNNFEPTLVSILRMLEIGFSLFEKYYTPFDKDNNVFMMPVLLERIQKSIWKIDYEHECVEQVTSKGTTVKIYFKDLVFFTFRKEGSDLRGTSLLRQAYYDWVDKKDIKQIAKKGITREMLGLPIGKVPPNVRSDSPEYDQFASLLDMLSSRDYLDTDDSIILPKDYELEMFKSDFKIEAIKDFLSYYDSSMAISVLAQFILLGQQGKGGSFSLGSDQSDFFMDGLQFVVDYVEAQYTKYIIHPAIKANWANIDPARFRLKGLNLNKKASKEFSDILKTLIDSGILKTQTADEKQIREMYGLPEIDEKEREENEPTEDDPDNNPDDGGDTPVEDEEDDEVKNALMEMAPLEIATFWKTGKQRGTYIDQEVKALTKYSKASLQIIADKLLSSIRWQLSKGSSQAQGLKDVKLNQNAVASYKKNMSQRLAAVTKKAWDNAKDNSAKHLEKLAVNAGDLPSKVLTAFIINQSDLSVTNQTNKLRDQSLLIANTASTKGYSLDQTLAQVEKGMDEFIASGNNAELANDTSIIQATSYGEQQYYKKIEDSLWGYRFDNVSPKTNICQSLVGKTYHVNSIEMEQVSPPLHFRCKSYYSPIYKTEEKPDQYDDYIPAPSILKEKTM